MDKNGNCFVDVDECFDGNHICPDDQMCINTIGSYQCEWYENAAIRNGKDIMIFEPYLSNGFNLFSRKLTKITTFFDISSVKINNTFFSFNTNFQWPLRHY